MTERCFNPENLDKLVDLAPGDPGLEHLEHCSACRSLLLSYRRFLDPGVLPEGARPDEARRELTRFISREFSDPGQDPTPLSFASRIWGALTGPLLRPGLALAALIMILGLYWTNQDGPSFQPPSGIVRELPSAGADTWQRLLSTSLDGGGYQLAWETLEGADGYRVELLDSSLLMIGSFDATATTSLELSGDDLAPLPGEPCFWRVVALVGGDEVTRSGTRSLLR